MLTLPTVAQIRRITPVDPLYPQECALREDVLLKPIGYDLPRFQREFAGLEDRFEHFVAVTHRPGNASRSMAGLDAATTEPASTNGTATGSPNAGDNSNGSAGGPCVIGCAALLPNYPAPGVGKLMQMAVDRQRQGEGIGRRLVVAVESRAFGELGLSELFCHAQVPAVGFYESLGWEIASDEFFEAGIPHRKMVMRSPGAPGESTNGTPADTDEIG
jgi:GNAT superfamily N-acetyltransferase